MLQINLNIANPPPSPVLLKATQPYKLLHGVAATICDHYRVQCNAVHLGIWSAANVGFRATT